MAHTGVHRWLPAAALIVLAGCSPSELPEIPEAGDLPLLADVGRAYEDVLADPRNPEANGRFAALLHRQGDLARAEIFYHRAFLLDTTNFAWIYRMAVVQLARDKYDAGVATLRHALRLKPDYAAGQFRLALAAFRMGNLVEAEEIGRRLATMAGVSAWARLLLGRIALSREAPNEAVPHFQAACEEFPGFGAARWSWGAAALALSRREEAKEQFILARRHRFEAPTLADPVLAEVLGDEIWPWQALARGYRQERRGALEQAERAYRHALELDPRCDAAHARLVSVYLRLGKLQEAEKHYREAIRLKPAQDDARAGYAALLMRQGRYQEARRAYREVLRINPAHVEALTYLAELLETAGAAQEAETLYREALDCEPGYREAAWRLGRLLVERERLEEAARILNQVAAVEDEQAPRYLLEIARLYLRAGYRKRAADYLVKARRLARKFGQAELLDRIEREARRY